MKLQRSCREVTRLVLEGEDRRLVWAERLGVQLHMLVCKACPNFRRQVRFMRQAMGRWKAYSEEDRAPDRPQ